MLMPNTTATLALARIEVLRQEVAATPIDLGNNEILQINLSAGIAGLPDDASTLSAKHLVSVADQRLLSAKRRGRGRCIATDDPEPDRPTGDTVTPVPGVVLQR